MKKYILIISLIFVSFIAFGQNEALDASLNYTETWKTYPGGSGDTIGTGDSTWTYVIKKRTDTKSFLYVYASLDSVKGAADTVNIYIQKKVNEGELFETVDTLIYDGSDNKKISKETTTSHTADFWQILMEGTNSTFNMHVDTLGFKFVKQ